MIWDAEKRRRAQAWRRAGRAYQRQIPGIALACGCGAVAISDADHA
ncbi:hypothetical protein KIF59_08200 [Enterobacter cloacae subsp. cloacae]|nr:hypothetical protein [Enterobacter cloacae subsp. cloacae]